MKWVKEAKGIQTQMPNSRQKAPRDSHVILSSNCVQVKHHQKIQNHLFSKHQNSQENNNKVLERESNACNAQVVVSVFVSNEKKPKTATTKKISPFKNAIPS